MNVRQYIQIYFALCSAGIIIAYIVPALNTRYLAYGARSHKASRSKHGLRGSLSQPENSPIKNLEDVVLPTTAISRKMIGILDAVSTFRVPHDWFKHFYYISVLSSAFWAYQLLWRGSILLYLLRHENASSKESMTPEQIILTWILMTMQGIRRLLESTIILNSSPSFSNMWILHWILGITFYIVTGIAVWIEGSSNLHLLNSSLHRFRFQTPSLRTLVGLPIFFIASGIQHDCHYHLSMLKKYSIPKLPLFEHIICPHYTMECLLYLSLSIIAAPQGSFFNRTLLWAFIFVTVNLGITADNTKMWWETYFGKESIKGRWRMMPYVW